MGDTWKNRSNLARKIGHTRENGSHLEKWVRLGKMGHTWKNGSHLEKRPKLEKRITLAKIGDTEEWVPH